MVVKMINLYNMKGIDCFFQKIGDCFNFTPSREFASELTEEEAKEIVSHKNFYTDIYNAEDMIILQ